MPWLDVISSDDWLSIWYYTNSPNGWTTGFDARKPTVVLLHPPWLASPWFRFQTDDPRLGGACNLLAFDARAAGRTKHLPSGRHDVCTDAADLAMLLQRLRLPAVHIFASEVVASHTALAFAALFPEMVHSLTLLFGRQQITANEVVFINQWSYADDMGGLQSIASDLYSMVFGQDATIDLIDDMVDYWITLYPPTRRVRTLEHFHAITSDTSLGADLLAAVTCPTLILQGRHAGQPRENALVDALAAQLTHVDGGARVLPVPAGTGYLHVVEPGTVNKTFLKFLAALAHLPAGPDAPPPPAASTERPSKRLSWDARVHARMRTALRRLGELTGRPELEERDPTSPLSFSLLGADAVTARETRLREFADGMGSAFNPLGPNGRPLRKFACRFQDQWSAGEIDASGMSVAGLGPRPKDAAHPTAPPSTAAQEHTLPPPAPPAELRVARRKPTLADNVIPLEKAARVAGDVRRLATHAALGMAGQLY